MYSSRTSLSNSISVLILTYNIICFLKQGLRFLKKKKKIPGIDRKLNTCPPGAALVTAESLILLMYPSSKE